MKNPSNVSESYNRGNSNASHDTPRGEFRNFVADIENLVKATTSATGDELIKAKAALNARVTAAKDSVEAMGEAMSDRARNTVKMTNSYVHAHPWQSLGIGTALGLIIGIVFSRRN